MELHHITIWTDSENATVTRVTRARDMTSLNWRERLEIDDGLGWIGPVSLP